MKSSCIEHPKRHAFIIVRAWQMVFAKELGKTAKVAAALMALYEYWHNVNLDSLEKKIQAGVIKPEEAFKIQKELLQYHVHMELQTLIMDIGGKNSIINANKFLVDKKVISIHKNPVKTPLYDNKNYYLFHPEVVNEWLKVNKDLPFDIKRCTVCKQTDYSFTSKRCIVCEQTDGRLPVNGLSLADKRTIAETTTETTFHETTTETTTGEDAAVLTEKDLLIESLKEQLKEKNEPNPLIPGVPLSHGIYSEERELSVYEKHAAIIENYNDICGLKGRGRYSISRGVNAIQKLLATNAAKEEQWGLEDIKQVLKFRAANRPKGPSMVLSPKTFADDLSSSYQNEVDYDQHNEYIAIWRKVHKELIGPIPNDHKNDMRHMLTITTSIEKFYESKEGEKELSVEDVKLLIEQLIRKFHETSDNFSLALIAHNAFSILNLLYRGPKAKPAPGTSRLDPRNEAARRALWDYKPEPLTF